MSKSKRKLLISMLVLMFVLLSAVAVVAIAFALTQQTITTTLNINYTVEDLDGSVYATYKVGGVETYLEPKATGGTVDGNSLVFSANDKQNAGSLTFPTDINLTSANDNIIIKYTYSNTGDKHYIASLSFDSELTFNNMSVEYSKDGDTYSTDRYAVVVPANSTNKSYWIKISISDKSKSASFTGDFNWNLNGYDKTDVAYPSLTSLTFTGDAGSYSASIASEGEYTGTIVFPSKVGTDSVTTIAKSTNLTTAQKQSVTGVVIPDSVTTIGNNAFENYTNLQTVTFKQNATTSSASVQSTTGLTKIGNRAFYNCSKLTSIDIPNSVTTIETSAFYGCLSLTDLIVPSSVTLIGNSAFSKCVGLESMEVASGNTVYHSAGNCLIATSTNTLIQGCKNSVIPTDGSVTIIGNSAFSGCTGLTSIIIPSNIKSIGGYAFENCTGLTELNLPNGLTSFAMSAYDGCTSLTKMYIPKCALYLSCSYQVGTFILTSNNLTSLELEDYDNSNWWCYIQISEVEADGSQGNIHNIQIDISTGDPVQTLKEIREEVSNRLGGKDINSCSLDSFAFSSNG